jgi:hypothetical protein
MNIKLARRRLSNRLNFRGLQISVETDKGEKRHWYDPHEKKHGVTTMKWPYGYIRRTEGLDGDHVDCFVGPNERAPKVYIVHQMKAPHFSEQDEDKCMLGFLSSDAAKKAYLQHYTDSRFFGSMTEMSFEDFKNKVARTFKHPAKIAYVETPMQTAKTAFLKYARYVGARVAQQEFAKYAAGLGDPNFWQGGSEAANAPPPPPPNEEEVVMSLPTGIFQGMNTKLDPMGQKSTSVKVTPEGLGQAEALAQIFQANPAAKVEISSPEAKAMGQGPGEAMGQEGAGGMAPGEGLSPTEGQVAP